MSKREFKSQTLRTPGQWSACVNTKLRIGQHGVQLFSAPAFNRFLEAPAATDIAISAQGELFWTALRDGVWQLIRSHREACYPEALLSLSSYGIVSPKRLWWTRRHLWVLDGPSARILGFDLQTFQVTREVRAPGRLIDAAIIAGPGKETVYALLEHQGAFEVRIYPAPPGQESSVTSPLLRGPAAIAASKDGTVVIFDAVLERFLTLRNGRIHYLGDARQPELWNFDPVAMEIEPGGAIYLALAKGELKIFDPEGSFLVSVKLPASVTSIRGMGFDASGGFYLSTNAGVAVFALSKVAVGVAGTLYPPVLDNGKTDGSWHGVALTVQLPAKSGIEVAYYASDDEGLKRLYTEALASTASAESKAATIESLLGPLWKSETGQFAGGGTGKRRDMLFVANRGRYLWLRIRLTSYDADSHPSIAKVEVRYPRISLLRYLPPVYQEDPVSAAFLERFLALFETVFQDVDATISDLHEYFDSATTPPEFLPWLASWLSLPLDDGLPEERKRRLISAAPSFLRSKGTPAGIRNFLGLYTGAAVDVREPSLLANPVTVGQVKLGQGSILTRRAGGALRIGDDTVLGEALLVPKSARPLAPLAATANRFEVFIDMDAARYAAQEQAILRAVRASVPASTAWTVRLAASQPAMGASRLGVNARIAGPQAFRIGFTRLGARGVALGARPSHDIPTPRLERGAAVTPDWRLIE